LRLICRFRPHNEAVLNAPGPVLLLPNHVSWWDWLLIGACLEEDWRFVTSSATAELSWLHKFIMVNRRTFPVDMNSPYAVKHMAEYLQQGGRLVLFPEGRLSCTGSLMKLFDGTGFLISKTRPKVITAYIRGAERLPFSPNPSRKRWFPGISVHFSGVLTPPSIVHVSAADDRARLTDWLRHRMLEQQFEVEMEYGPTTVPAAVAETARQSPGRTILQDFTLQEVSYRRLLIGADLLSIQWRTVLGGQAGQRVGVLLPNVNATPVTLLSLWSAGKIPAVLNYSSGPAVLLTCARLAGLRQIVTSKAFLTGAKLEAGAFAAAGIELVYLEDVRAKVSAGQKFTAWLRSFKSPVRKPSPGEGEPAVVLFTSGSEGEPKGVELTHRNLLANIRQMLAVVDVMETDRFFNALPLFHSFGLTIGLLLPLVRGAFSFLYLSPLHYRVVPAAFYNLNCTVLFGTNTFLSGYARKAHPYDFRTLRYVFAGAEKLQAATSAIWMHKFGVRILEGYGATECSPCLTANVPLRPREGSVGQFLPGIEFKLEPVEGVSQENPQPGSPAPQNARAQKANQGRLMVRGPNIMKGYVNPEANVSFQALGGWYDTGDIVKVDADGFVFVLGRLKRFAKISGEMVSLTAVEEALANAFPQYGPRFAIAVVVKPDEHKGEKLVAVTNEPKTTMTEIREAIHARGLSNLAVPREIKVVHEIPRLATGKVNHRELEKLV
jgi:acyl-[acyl-carrier-protein]-phospholipid O-acyltransferase/long-chain-fatty-acid--[acyl-carrier-protein] ligase